MKIDKKIGFCDKIEREKKFLSQKLDYLNHKFAKPDGSSIFEREFISDEDIEFLFDEMMKKLCGFENIFDGLKRGLIKKEIEKNE